MQDDDHSWRGFWGYVLLLVLAGGIAAGLYFAFRPQFSRSDRTSVNSKYADALKVAMQFFDVQKSGKLEKNPIKWRGDSGLNDGKEEDLDLTKGMYDAGDHMKFGFPMAYTATVLAWAILEYGERLTAAQQLNPAKTHLRWITDYLINAHPEENVLYIQVGDPKEDHQCWDRPETMTEKRPLTQVNTSKPGTDVAAETAAAMAAASIVFKDVSSYSETLLKHAKQLFNFADKYREIYSTSIPDVAKFYRSSSFEDELLWAASWLYHATKNNTYIDFVHRNAERFRALHGPTWFSWDNKLPGAQMLLSRLALLGGTDSSTSSSLQGYKDSVEILMCSIIPESPRSTPERTKGGLIWVSEWGALMHPVAAAFLATIYSDYMHASRTSKFSCAGQSYKASVLRDFAQSQADYILGKNPMKMSYLVGHGDKYPQYVHHRGASIPADAETGCKDGMKWLNSSEPNPNVATGALVGGPFKNETFNDGRNNSMQTEPTTYNSALVVGLLSGLLASDAVQQSFT